MARTSPALLELMANHGVEKIGTIQRTIAYASIADAGGGLVTITADAHGLKKHQSIYISSGADYINSYTVYKVLSANTFQIYATFTVTRAGNINLMVCLNGHGFIVETAIVIAEFVPDDRTLDAVALLAGPWPVGDEVFIPFKKLRLTSGDVTAIRKTPQTTARYTNR